MASSTLPALASVPDLARRAVGDPDGIVEGTPEHVRAQVALEDASSAAREASGDLDRWPDALDAPHPVVRVVLAAARRWWENPEAYTGESISDGLSYSRRAEGVSVALTDDERRTCAAYGGSGGGGLGSVGLVRSGAGQPATLVYASVGDGAGTPLRFLDAEDHAAPDPEEA